MQKIIFFFLMMAALAANGQPEGRLYLLSSQNNQTDFGFLSFPGGLYTHIDMLEAASIIPIGDKLFLTSGSTYAPKEDAFVYDSGSLQKAKTLDDTWPIRFAPWQDKILMLSAEAPHLRVFETEAPFAMQASFLQDSIYQHKIFRDLVVNGDTAYVLLENGLMVFDMLREDTLGIFITHQIAFAANSILIDFGEHLYIDQKAHTALTRSYLYRFNKSTHVTDSIYEVLFQVAQLRPVVAEDEIFLYNFPAHYTPQADSLFLPPGFSNQLSLAYDPLSQSLFVYNGNDSIYYVSGQDTSSLFPIPVYPWASTFVPALKTGLGGKLTLKPLEFFPNPAQDHIRLKLGGVQNKALLSLTDVQGKKLLERQINSSEEVILEIGTLSAGIYFLEVQSDIQRWVGKLVKK